MKTLDLEIRSLRERILLLPTASNGKRLGIPVDLKIAITQAMIQSNLTPQEFSGLVAVSAAALCTWKRQRGGAAPKKVRSTPALPSFKQLCIDGARAEALPKTPAPQGLCLEGPNGLSIQGLSLNDVATLWKSLC